MSEDHAAETSGQGIYEVGYHIVPTVGDEGLTDEVGAVRSAVESSGGAVFAEEWPEHFSLSYPMDKEVNRARKTFDESYFGWMRFEAAPGTLAGIQETLAAMPNMLRFILVKSVREVPQPQGAHDEEQGEHPATDTDTLDSEIDKLVTAK